MVAQTEELYVDEPLHKKLKQEIMIMLRETQQVFI